VQRIHETADGIHIAPEHLPDDIIRLDLRQVAAWTEDERSG
jgi:hypothetical protein